MIVIVTVEEIVAFLLLLVDKYISLIYKPESLIKLI